MICRRTALVAMAAAGLGGLSATCRDRPTEADEVIRAWFRDNHLIEPSTADLAAIRAWLVRPVLHPDPAIQPSLLFNPEVDIG